MIVLLLAVFALAETPPAMDLDGDGKPETLSATEQGVTIGAHKVVCDGSMGTCDVEIHDLVGTDKAHEVAICEHGPRDDRSCRLFRYDKKGMTEVVIEVPYPPAKLITAGNGLILTESWADRMYTRIEKYAESNGRYQRVPQQMYAAALETVHIDRTFPLLYGPDSRTVVANVRPDSDVQIVAEHGEKDDWYLIKLSSGITGWAQLDTLSGASDMLMSRFQAG